MPLIDHKIKVNENGHNWEFFHKYPACCAHHLLGSRSYSKYFQPRTKSWAIPSFVNQKWIIPPLGQLHQSFMKATSTILRWGPLKTFKTDNRSPSRKLAANCVNLEYAPCFQIYLISKRGGSSRLYTQIPALYPITLDDTMAIPKLVQDQGKPEVEQKQWNLYLAHLYITGEQIPRKSYNKSNHG